MSRKLNSSVSLADPEKPAVMHTFGPDDDLPTWVVKFLDDAAKDAGLDRHPAFADQDEPETKKPRGRKAD